MSVTTSNRSIDALLPVAQRACRLFLDECKKAGVNIFLTETHRSQARQNWLYAQGRTRFPGAIVTWTLNSNHTTGLAWDVAVSPPKSLYDVATLNRAGAIARKLNIKWGGDWIGTIDRPHFQVPTNWTPPKGYETKPSEDIKNLQASLNQVGFKVGVTGLIDKSTTNAVMIFQRRVGIKIDGIAGRDTTAKLKEVIAKNTATPKKEVDEMAQKLPHVQQKDMKNLLTKAYNTRDDKGNRIFSDDHTSKVDTMTRGQATDLLISYVARTAK